MGFDPRRWRPAAGSPPVTSNVEALLAENDALRREVRTLQRRLEHLQHQGHDHTRWTHGLSPDQVERWGQAMAAHPQWQGLRIGPPAGLRGVIDKLRSRWWNPELSLEQELDRRAPGLGAELAEALRGPHSRVRWAVRAAFALYGQRAPEWLGEAPLQVVGELLRRQEQLGQRRRGTRTQNHSHTKAPAPAADPRSGALRELGLEPEASLAMIKRAYRRLAKAHHPDLGGNAKAFHRLEAAYRLLVG
ncbi:MAG: DnaJ domain-containing protein [Synechococcus sp.]|nr:DnaJ domain-containing protein [Synechococcus sp.]